MGNWMPSLGDRSSGYHHTTGETIYLHFYKKFCTNTRLLVGNDLLKTLRVFMSLYVFYDSFFCYKELVMGISYGNSDQFSNGKGHYHFNSDFEIFFWHKLTCD